VQTAFRQHLFVPACRLALLLLCLLVPSAGLADELPILADILKKSKEALAPPVRYRIRLNGRETTVSQKVLANGVLASRTEAVSPSQTIVITLGDDNYDVLTQSRVVIDKTGIALGAFSPSYLRGSELSNCYIPSDPTNATIADQQLATITRGEKEYYAVTTTFSSEQLKSTSLMQSILGSGTVASSYLVVDKQTLTPVELEYLSPLGASISSYEFLEILRLPEPTDDDFILPAEYKVEFPATMQDYFALHDVYWDDIVPPPKRRPFFPRILKPLDLSRFSVTFDPATGLPIPKGQTVDQVQKAIRELRQSHHPPPVEPSSRRLWLVAVNLSSLTLLLLIGMAVRSRHRRKTTGAIGVNR